MQARRRDPRLLLALATPWILFFALLPQMHQRYLVWGAAITALAIGVDISLALLHGVITAAAWGMQAHSMLKDHYNFSLLAAISGRNPPRRRLRRAPVRRDFSVCGAIVAPRKWGG
jgi:hypothetical protein